MAEKRMFSKQIIDSDAFLDMPLSTQALYFHLSMRADDDGFVDNPKKIQRMVGASSDDLKLLLSKRYILAFESGVIVIKHWRIHNTIRMDRYKETVYIEEKSQLTVKDNRAYTEKDRIYTDSDNMETIGLPVGNQMETQNRLDKDRLDKDRLDKGSKPKRETTQDILERLLPNYPFSEVVVDKIHDWIKYKTEKKDSYKEQGMKSLLNKIFENTEKFGDLAVCSLIDECMANGWKGIIWDKLKDWRGYSTADRIANRVDDVDNW